MYAYLHEIWNLSSQGSIWPPHKISWGSELSLGRYFQNNCHLFNPLLPMYFAYFQNLSIKVSSKFEKYVKFLWIFENTTSKCTCIRKVLPYIRGMKMALGSCIYLKLYISSCWTPCRRAGKQKKLLGSENSNIKSVCCA